MLKIKIDEKYNLKSNSFLNLTLKNTMTTHDCEMLEYWTEKTFPDGSTFSLDIINKSKFSIQFFN